MGWESSGCRLESLSGQQPFSTSLGLEMKQSTEVLHASGARTLKIPRQHIKRINSTKVKDYNKLISVRRLCLKLAFPVGKRPEFLVKKFPFGLKKVDSLDIIVHLKQNTISHTTSQTA